MATTIRLLEQRVHDVVARLRELSAERERLREELRTLKERAAGLGDGAGAERSLDAGDRARIVAEIRGALDELRGGGDRASRGPTP